MLFVEALETAKCFEEGVIESAAAANIGSIMGIGFPPNTGGAAQFMTGYEDGATGRDRPGRVRGPGRRAGRDVRRPVPADGVPPRPGREGRVLPRLTLVTPRGHDLDRVDASRRARAASWAASRGRRAATAPGARRRRHSMSHASRRVAPPTTPCVVVANGRCRTLLAMRRGPGARGVRTCVAGPPNRSPAAGRARRRRTRASVAGRARRGHGCRRGRRRTAGSARSGHGGRLPPTTSARHTGGGRRGRAKRFGPCQAFQPRGRSIRARARCPPHGAAT